MSLQPLSLPLPVPRRPAAGRPGQAACVHGPLHDSHKLNKGTQALSLPLAAGLFQKPGSYFSVVQGGGWMCSSMVGWDGWVLLLN